MVLRIIGLMSGSSLDGLDMAYCTIGYDKNLWTWSIEDCETIHFDPTLSGRLLEAPYVSGKELMKLDADFGKWIGKNIAHRISQRSLSPTLIGSHGHTVFHDPAQGFSTQIGSGAHIAAGTGIDTISDFRAMDVALGGQGAPFAPVVDQLLFAGHSAYLNLGGIVNMTLQTDEHMWNGWDIAPCNQALNYLARQLGKPYDQDGLMASAAVPDEMLCAQLMSDFPFRQKEPFSISNQLVHDTWITKLRSSGLPVPILLATTTEAIARMIALQLVSTLSPGNTVMMTGGGAHNLYLLQRIRELTLQKDIQCIVPEKNIVDFKESLLMALLAYMMHQDIPFPLHTITGSSRDAIGGVYHKAG